MRRPIAVILLVLLTACASHSPMPAVPAGDGSAPDFDVLLVGEQHDAPDHQAFHRQVVASLAAHGKLAALTLEMAERGGSTVGLPRHASEAEVRAALRWNDAAWPWQSYGPAVMAAVAAGVPVVGGNLPRAELRAAMADDALDALLPGPALKAQQQAMRAGHCELLPESQIGPMTRMQIARDRAMAQTVLQVVAPGKAVLLLAGAAHVDPTLGVPQHLPKHLRVKSTPLPARPHQKDYCAELARTIKAKP